MLLTYKKNGIILLFLQQKYNKRYQLQKNIITSLLRRSTNLQKMSTTAENDVLFNEIGDKGIITLNRPKALNALDTSMVNKLYPTLAKWQTQKSLVIIKGAGGKAFCAGGDVKSLALAGLKGDRSIGEKFFKEEYKTNGLIGNYKIPYVAFISGIVMGGGVGLSVHGKYRVATETTTFAMPETQIGLFPDVGGSYFLPRLPGKLGLYLALTGYRLKGVDVLKAGIATHFCDSKKLDEVESDLIKCADEAAIKKVLEKHNDIKGEFSLSPHLQQINRCFSGDSVEEIIARLEKDGSEWAKKTIETLNKMSPTSLKVTVKLLGLGANLNLDQCLQMEYRLAVNCLANTDFYEGN